MSELIFGFVLTAVIMILSWILGDWNDIFPKRKNKYTVKYDKGKQITFYKNGKIVNHKVNK